MDVSVVVPTLNGRERLARALDALAEHAPASEVVVVNGPSADGTTGMVRARDDVDVLLEVATRTLNVARNAGIDAASGDVVALLGQDLVVEPGWFDAVVESFAGTDADVVTGPSRQQLRAGVTAEESESARVGDREVTYFNGDNVAFRMSVLRELDGFDEYLETGGARDAAHRLAGLGRSVVWTAAMGASREVGADGGRTDRDWGWKYRSIAYRLVKNYGVRPSVAAATGRAALTDAYAAARDVASGESKPTAWLANGRDVVVGAVRGASDGLVARVRDRSPTRNPHGLSRRADRAVARYDDP
ncbi:MAG: glycosyltransferase family 2 protein [Haloferacaceae archaeon]